MQLDTKRKAAYGIKTLATPKELGDFGYQTVTGIFDPKPEHFDRDMVLHNLTNRHGWWWGTFFDEEGGAFTILRSLLGDITRSLMFLRSIDGKYMDMDRKVAGASFRGGPLDARYSQDFQRYSIGSFTGGKGQPSFQMVHSLDKATWKEFGAEGEIMNITGRPTGPGHEMYTPWRDGGWCYLGFPIVGEGTVLGKKVRGWFSADQMYMMPGFHWFSAPFVRKIEVAWFAFYNWYEDETWMTGQLFLGLQNFNYFILCDSEGTRFTSHNVLARIEQKQNGYPKKYILTVDGEEWEWDPTPHGELHALEGLPGNYRGSEGRCRRVGDKREPVFQTAWSDFFNDGRLVEFHKSNV